MISGIHKEVERVITLCTGLITLDEVNALQEAQDIVLQGGELTPAFVASDAPIWCDGISFYRPSIAADTLIDEYEELEGVFKEDWQFDIFCILVLHNARNKEFFRTISKDNVIERVLAFQRLLTIDILEVRQLWLDAYNGFPQITNIQEQERLKAAGKEINTEVDHLLTTSQLMKHYGGNLDYWFYDVSCAQVIWLTQASYKCLDDGDTPNPDSPLSKAQMNFIAIRKRVILRCREMKI